MFDRNYETWDDYDPAVVMDRARQAMAGRIANGETVKLEGVSWDVPQGAACVMALHSPFDDPLTARMIREQSQTFKESRNYAS